MSVPATSSVTVTASFAVKPGAYSTVTVTSTFGLSTVFAQASSQVRVSHRFENVNGPLASGRYRR